MSQIDLAIVGDANAKGINFGDTDLLRDLELHVVQWRNFQKEAELAFLETCSRWSTEAKDDPTPDDPWLLYGFRLLYGS